MNNCAATRCVHEIKSIFVLAPATIRPNDWLLIVAPTSAAEVSFTAQNVSGDSHHHDKTSSRAARHYGVDGDALHGRAIARANRADHRGTGAVWRSRPRRKAQTAAEGRAEGRTAQRRTTAWRSARGRSRLW